VAEPQRRPIAWLVRHAQSVWNAEALVQGQDPAAPGLTADGTAAARRLADRLAGCGAGAVLASDLRRAVETAAPIAARLGVPLRTDARLRERNLGVLEGGPSAALDPALLGWGGGGVDPGARPPGGESLRELYARALGWVEAVRRDPPAPVFVAVTHGGFLRVALACIAGEGLDAMRPTPIPNGALWRADLLRAAAEPLPAEPLA
jgi:2,3-bisphosphoglycerate-dependent phosphoglycerate mutase